ncbi:MAG TPA: pyridoxamine 5'-phosphate oxidase family protein [Chthonomonadaceae bacterium]|nr:pyridoxamine 5'-phosphate oxidase family protein [Chthonomonadaceae bacterium]
MSTVHDCIDEKLAAWIKQQHLFFVATAPLSPEGHINCSPKGGDSFRILGPMEIAYQDYTGSGAETAAHLRENGRIVVLFCAFEGKPIIVRLHGQGTVLLPGYAGFDELAEHFPPNPGTRALVQVQVTRVSTSCGYGVPLYQFQADRDLLDKWAVAKGDTGLATYRATNNANSVDGLPAFFLPEAPE